MSPMQPTLSIRYCLLAPGIIILPLSASGYCPLSSPRTKWNHGGDDMTEALNVEEGVTEPPTKTPCWTSSLPGTHRLVRTTMAAPSVKSACYGNRRLLSPLVIVVYPLTDPPYPLFLHSVGLVLPLSKLHELSCSGFNRRASPFWSPLLFLRMRPPAIHLPCSSLMVVQEGGHSLLSLMPVVMYNLRNLYRPSRSHVRILSLLGHSHRRIWRSRCCRRLSFPWAMHCVGCWRGMLEARYYLYLFLVENPGPRISSFFHQPDIIPLPLSRYARAAPFLSSLVCRCHLPSHHFLFFII
ncbi:hypothetical protein ARMSODRAFT_488 [Armillaria solidipes]|uniref:Secreted protein n=1 Tax=Armillaria solidipes TaxID=1076256 RepID=A0A2H3CLI7_9AGAR|nr:hypothetical protein ARMSODRAFT_488 [Armillaria solidipes]